MVTVALLSFIILGLVAMFSQTQRAFTTSMSQTDRLETGRAVTEMLARELAEITPSGLPRTTNFFSEMDALDFNKPVYQYLMGGGTPPVNRTNVIQRFFFLSRQNQEWSGIGYKVVPDYPDAGVGTLYRYMGKLHNNRRYEIPLLSSNFVASARLTNRIADGIIHLRLRAFDRDGRLITPFWPTNYALRLQSARYWNPVLKDQVDSYYVSNAVPAFLELEVGVLESQTLQRFKSIGQASAAVQRQFLSNHVAQVHLFRQRIPVRNVEPSVYQ